MRQPLGVVVDVGPIPLPLPECLVTPVLQPAEMGPACLALPVRLPAAIGGPVGVRDGEQMAVGAAGRGHGKR